MKAKELKDKARKTARYGKHTLVKYVFTEEEMAIFCSQLCAEQRKIICKEIFNADNIDIDQIARLVAEPEIE